MQTSLENFVFVNTKNYLDKRTTPLGIASNQNQILAVADQVMEKLRSKNKKLLNERLKNGEITDLNQVLDGVLISCNKPWKPALDLSNHPRQQMIFNMMQGNVPDLDEIRKDSHLVPAIIFKKDKQVLAESRNLIRKIFDDMIIQLEKKNPPMSEAENFHMEMIIGDLLALFPFLRPQSGSKLKVPMKIVENGNTVWKMIEFTVKELTLTPLWMGSPVTAYGLSSKHVAPIILFKGTTYPTDKGFALSLLTDVNPLGSVGSYAFNIGKPVIKQWLDAHTTHYKATVIGKSLGGIESCMTALHFPDQVEKVMAYGAPGFSLSDLRKLNALRIKREEEQGHFPNINVFCQKNDPTPYCDRAAKKGVNYYQVIGTEVRKGVMAHADMYSMHSNSIILKLDQNEESQKIKRIATTSFRTFLSVFAFPFLTLVYIAYVIGEKTVHCFRSKNIKTHAR